jgi:AraC family transcriptional regulator
MTQELQSKYGLALTGSDWVGLPLRIGHVPEDGYAEGLAGEVDAVLVWSGGPSQLRITYDDPRTNEQAVHEFLRVSGTIDLLPRGTYMHRIEWTGKPSTCTSVNLPPACLRALSAEPVLGLDAARGPQFGLVDSHVVDLVHRLHEQAEGQATWGAVYVQSLSLALASYLSVRYGVESEGAPALRPATLSRTQRSEIERFVDVEMSSNFGLVDLAKLVGYSPDHFSRLFKQSFNQSPHQFVLSRRIDKAMAMLHDEELTIAHIASACGFTDQGHLTKVFKQRVGMTPGTYRKR